MDYSLLLYFLKKQNFDDDLNTGRNLRMTIFVKKNEKG